MYGGQPARTFSKPAACVSGINPATVSTLVPAWRFDTRAPVTASPVVAGGTVYVGDWHGVMHALDAATGDERWAFQTADAPGAAFGPIVSSAAVAGGLVVFGAGPRLYALDAESGGERWSTDLSEGVVGSPVEIESSPLIWEGRVFVGVDPHDHPSDRTGGVDAGGLWAFSLLSGNPNWHFDPAAAADARAAGAVPATPTQGCDGVWSSPALDAGRRTLYVGTASCSGDDSAWTDDVNALVAVDADSGAREWSFRPHPPNHSDWDFGATPNVFTDGDGDELVGIGGKDGAYYAVYRGDAGHPPGTVKWSTQAAAPGDVTDDFSIGGFIGSPAVDGGGVFGATAIGGAPYYHALDGTTGARKWYAATAPSYAASGAVNGVVFAGSLDGVLHAFDESDGVPRWSISLGAPVSSGVAVAGDSVFVGSGTSSSDACAKGVPVFSDVCFAAFDGVLGSVGAVNAFRLIGGNR
jgi:polyvinyl alcohol dehydrogenase (cytochrome)